MFLKKKYQGVHLFIQQAILVWIPAFGGRLVLGGCAAEPCNLSSRLRSLTEGVPQTEHRDSGVEARPRQDNTHPQPEHRAGKKGRT